MDGFGKFGKICDGWVSGGICLNVIKENESFIVDIGEYRLVCIMRACLHVASYKKMVLYKNKYRVKESFI